jgi:hypothetical protein
MLRDLVTREARPGHFFVQEESPAVQFLRCEPGPVGLSSGRIWAEMDVFVRLGSGEQYALVRKDPAFEEFYDRLARWMRRTYKRDTATGSYVGPAAQRRRDGGGRLLP